MRCSICDTPRQNVINTMLAAGRSLNAIEREMKALGNPIKHETVARHLHLCLNDNPQQGLVEGRVPSGDFAAMVRDRAVEALNEGALKIRTSDGLQAQALLDRRAEKAADRDLMVNIARLLSGAQSSAPDEIIEGEFREVFPMAPLELVSGE